MTKSPFDLTFEDLAAAGQRATAAAVAKAQAAGVAIAAAPNAAIKPKRRAVGAKRASGRARKGA